MPASKRKPGVGAAGNHAVSEAQELREGQKQKMELSMGCQETWLCALLAAA